MGKKKDKIPAPGGKKDPYTNFMKKAKWTSALHAASLDISGKNFQKEGSVIIAHVLLKNSFIETLNIEHNHIGDAGITEFAQMLKVNTTIRVIKVGVNELTDVGGVMLASAFLVNQTVTHIHAQGNSFRDDTALAFAFVMRSNMEIKHLDLSWNAIGDRGARGICDTFKNFNPGFRFELAQNKISDDGAKAISEALRGKMTETLHGYLNLWQNDIGRQGGMALAPLLEMNNQLKQLNLSWNSIGAAGAEAIAKAMQTNVGCGEWRPPSEEEKNVFRTKWLEDGYKKVDDMKFQKGNDTKIIPLQLWQQDPLRPTCTITELNLSHNLITDPCCLELGKLIALSAPLQYLNLSFNLITSPGAITLTQSLKEGTNLLSLNLSFNKLTDTVAPAIVELIRTCSTLISLQIQRNELKDGKNVIMNNMPKGGRMRVNYGAMDDVGMEGYSASYGGTDEAQPSSRRRSRLMSTASGISMASGDTKSARKSGRKSTSRGSVSSLSTDTTRDMFGASPSFR